MTQWSQCLWQRHGNSKVKYACLLASCQTRLTSSLTRWAYLIIGVTILFHSWTCLRRKVMNNLLESSYFLVMPFMIWETTCMKLLFVSQSVSCSYSFSSFEISRLALQHCDAWNINIKMFWFYLEHHIVKWNVHNLHPLSRTFEWTVSTLLLRMIFKLRSIEVFTWLNTVTRN